MMVALLLYCWSRGVRSSRAIERACVEDVACRVIAAQQRPDHATIARFVVRHERALGELFGEVLALCADAGLATVGVIAIDGTKVARQRQPRPHDGLRAARRDDRRRADRHRRRRDELPRRRARRRAAARSWPAAGPAGLAARPRASGSTASAPSEARADPALAPERGCTDAKRRLEEELAVERDANEHYEAYRARGVMRNGRRFGPPAQALHAARRRRTARSTSPTPTPSWSRACAAGSRATTPRRPATSST